MQTSFAPPEENQLVRVRGQHWVVRAVRPNVLDVPQHLVEVTSVEDDGLGEGDLDAWMASQVAGATATEEPTPKGKTPTRKGGRR